MKDSHREGSWLMLSGVTGDITAGEVLLLIVPSVERRHRDCVVRRYSSYVSNRTHQTR